MKLSHAKSGGKFTIMANDATGRARARLDSLGLVVGTTVVVISASYAGLIVGIKGSRLAIGKDVAALLTVEEAL